MTDDDPREFPLALPDALVRAVLDGRKTQHRVPVLPANSTVLGDTAKRYWPNLWFDHAIPRNQSTLFLVLLGPDKAPPNPHLDVPYQHPDDPLENDVANMRWYRVRPKWEAGDRFWIKESWQRYRGFGESQKPDAPVIYRIDRDDCGQYPCVLDGQTVLVNDRNRWQPPGRMPRSMSRITLEIVRVRGERIGDISHTDIAAEGVLDDFDREFSQTPYHYGRDKQVFAQHWDQRNGKTCPWESNGWCWVTEFRRVTS